MGSNIQTKKSGRSMLLVASALVTGAGPVTACDGGDDGFAGSVAVDASYEGSASDAARDASDAANDSSRFDGPVGVVPQDGGYDATDAADGEGG